LYVLQIYYYIMIIITYVNNLIILVSDMDMINKLKSIFEHIYKMNNLNKLHLVLEVHFEMDRTTHTIIMHQESYIESILK
jgi:hypothetical protein